MGMIHQQAVTDSRSRRQDRADVHGPLQLSPNESGCHEFSATVGDSSLNVRVECNGIVGKVASEQPGHS